MNIFLIILFILIGAYAYAIFGYVISNIFIKDNFNTLKDRTYTVLRVLTAIFWPLFLVLFIMVCLLFGFICGLIVLTLFLTGKSKEFTELFHDTNITFESDDFE